MPEYGTNIIFRLSVEGSKAVTELDNVIKQMQAALATFNTTASNSASGLNALTGSSVTMGAAMGDAANKAGALAANIEKVAVATQKLGASQPAAKAATNLNTVLSPAGYGINPQEQLGVSLTSQAKLAALPPAVSNYEQLLRGQRYGITLMGSGQAGFSEAIEGDWENLTKKMTADSLARQNQMLANQGEYAKQQSQNQINDFFTKYDMEEQSVTQWNKALNLQGSWHPGNTASGQPMTLMDTFAAGAEAKTLELWGIRRAGFDLQQLGRTSMYSGIAFMTAMAMMVNSYSDFNYATTRASATMRLPVELFDQLEEGVRGAAVETARFSPVQVAEGLRQWAAGTGEVVTSTEQLNRILADTTTIQKLAAMNSVDLSGTMQGVGGAMTSFGLGTEDVAHVVSVFNYVAQESFANVDDLGQAFTFVGPLAKQMGISLEETAAALALLSDANIKGSMAGRAFRQMLMSLGDPTSSVSKALDNLLAPMLKTGETWQSIVWKNGEFIGLAEYVDVLAASVENLSAAEQVQALAQLATANQLPATITLVREQVEARKIGVNIISVYSKLLNNTLDEEVYAYKRWYEGTTGAMFSVEGAMARFNDQWEEYIESPAGQMDRLKQQWNSAMLAMAKPLADSLIPALEYGTEILGRFIDLLGATSWAMPFIFGLTAISTGLSSIILLAGKALQMWALVQTMRAGVAEVAKAGGFAAALAANKAGALGAVAATVIPTLPIIGAGIITAAIADAYFVAQQKEETKALDLLDNASRSTQARFDEWFKQASFGGEAGPGQLLWVPQTEEAARAMQAITGEAVGFRGTAEEIDAILKFINGDLTDMERFVDGVSLAALGLKQQMQEVADIRGWMSGQQYHAEDPFESSGVLDEDQLKMVGDIMDYRKQQIALRDRYNKDEANMISQYNDWVESEESSHIQNLNDMAADYGRSALRRERDYGIADSRAWTDYQESLSAIQEDAQEEREKAAEDYYDRLQKLERDHADKMVDLLEKRDVQGLTKEVRSYRNSILDMDKERAKDEATREDNTQKKLADAQEAYEKQRKIEEENRALARKDAAEDYALQIQDAITAHESRMAEKANEHDKELAQLKSQLVDDNKALDADLAEKVAIFNGAADALARLLGPDLLLKTQKWFEDYKAIWETNLLEIISLIDAMALMDSQYEGGPAAGPDEYAQQYAGRAAGGYAAYGNYLLGEQGKEFVLSAPTTSMMEGRYGYLNQSSFAKMGSNFTFAPVFQGVGRQDMGYIKGEMDRWWVGAQKDLVRLVR